MAESIKSARATPAIVGSGLVRTGTPPPRVAREVHVAYRGRRRRHRHRRRGHRRRRRPRSRCHPPRRCPPHRRRPPRHQPPRRRRCRRERRRRRRRLGSNIANARASAPRSPQRLLLCEKVRTKMRRFERRVALGAALAAGTARSHRTSDCRGLVARGPSANFERRVASRSARVPTVGLYGTRSVASVIWHTSSMPDARARARARRGARARSRYAREEFTKTAHGGLRTLELWPRIDSYCERTSRGRERCRTSAARACAPMEVRNLLLSGPSYARECFPLSTARREAPSRGFPQTV